MAEKPNFSRDPVVQMRVDSLLSLAEKYERCQLIPYSEIDKICGENHNKSTAYKRFRKELRERRKIVSIPKPGAGLYLPSPDEQTVESKAKRIQKASNNNRRMIREVSTASPSDLSDHVRRLQDATIYFGIQTDESLRTFKRTVTKDPRFA